MTRTAYAYAEITKSDEQPDGTLMVHGVVSDSGLDSDGQRMSGAFLRKSLGDWFRGYANVREQHSNIAAGVGVDLIDAGGDTWELRSHIVDPSTVAKVRAGVLKGYSIAATKCRIEKGRSDAPNGLVVDGEIYEVSLVDRPSRGSCRISIVKSHGGQLELSDAFDQEDNEMTHRDFTAAQDLVERALTGELHTELTKAADGSAMLNDAHDAVSQIAGLARAELLLLEQDADNGDLVKGFNMGGLIRAVEALKTFVDHDASRMVIKLGDNVESIQKSYTGWVASWAGEGDDEPPADGDVTKSAGTATVGADVIQKAVREATGTLEAELQTLRGELAEVQKMARPNGPILKSAMPTQTAVPADDRAQKISFLRARIANPSLDSGTRSAHQAHLNELLAGA